MRFAAWFWYFLGYSFLGWLLEKWFARRTGAANQNRKCLLGAPLCPVYGLGMTAVLALPEAWRAGPWLVLSGAAVTTAVEYAVHWAYDALLGVRFWDYSGVRGNLHGRVCLPFTLAWGALTAAAVWLVQPALVWLAAGIPPAATLAALVLFAADAVCSARFLVLTHDPAALSLRAVRL